MGNNVVRVLFAQTFLLAQERHIEKKIDKIAEFFFDFQII
jgi:hypothetical protein